MTQARAAAPKARRHSRSAAAFRVNRTEACHQRPNSDSGGRGSRVRGPAAANPSCAARVPTVVRSTLDRPSCGTLAVPLLKPWRRVVVGHSKGGPVGDLRLRAGDHRQDLLAIENEDAGFAGTPASLVDVIDDIEEEVIRVVPDRINLALLKWYRGASRRTSEGLDLNQSRGLMMSTGSPVMRGSRGSRSAARSRPRTYSTAKSSIS